MTALRLVQRMKRDSMHTGRRPSGLCGAGEFSKSGICRFFLRKSFLIHSVGNVVAGEIKIEKYKIKK